MLELVEKKDAEVLQLVEKKDAEMLQLAEKKDAKKLAVMERKEAEIRRLEKEVDEARGVATYWEYGER